MTVHHIKTWLEYFDDMVSGAKPFELRLNDRRYRAGDLVVHWAYDRRRQRSTGEHVVRKIGYVMPRFKGLREGYIIFSQVMPTWQEWRQAMKTANTFATN